MRKTLQALNGPALHARDLDNPVRARGLKPMRPKWCSHRFTKIDEKTRLALPSLGGVLTKNFEVSFVHFLNPIFPGARFGRDKNPHVSFAPTAAYGSAAPSETIFL